MYVVYDAILYVVYCLITDVVYKFIVDVLYYMIVYVVYDTFYDVNMYAISVDHFELINYEISKIILDLFLRTLRYACQTYTCRHVMKLIPLH